MCRNGVFLLVAIAGLLCQCTSTIVETKSEKADIGSLNAEIRKYVSADEPKQIKNRKQIKFENYLILLGYDLSQSEYHPGESFTITWYWKCRRPVTSGWKLFTHGVDTEGRILLNGDLNNIRTFASVRQKFPPSAWRPQTYIKDVVTWKIPQDFEHKQFELRTGIWMGNDRIPIVSSGGDEENRARGPIMKKKPPKRIQLTIPKVKADAVIDGKFKDEAAWKNALKLNKFKEILQGSKARSATELQLMWTEKHLYVAMEAADNFLSTAKDSKDDEIWKGDALTILLDPGGDEKNYYEIQVNPQRKFYDAVLQSYRKSDASWKSKAKYKVALKGKLDDDEKGDERWALEMKIPLDSFGNEKPKPGDEWLVNFFRTDATKDGIHYSAWSAPLRADFHYFKKFGRVVFSD